MLVPADKSFGTFWFLGPLWVPKLICGSRGLLKFFLLALLVLLFRFLNQILGLCCWVFHKRGRIRDSICCCKKAVGANQAGECRERPYLPAAADQCESIKSELTFQRNKQFKNQIQGFIAGHLLASEVPDGLSDIAQEFCKILDEADKSRAKDSKKKAFLPPSLPRFHRPTQWIFLEMGECGESHI